MRSSSVNALILATSRVKDGESTISFWFSGVNEGGSSFRLRREATTCRSVAAKTSQASLSASTLRKRVL